jgi:DNA polymerase-3 subunit delta
MEVKNPNEIIHAIKKKEYHPIYFLGGEETFYVDRITKYIQEHVLTEEEKTFNQTVIYGKDADAGAVIGAAKRFPMMSDYQVVIVKEAQHLKKFEDLVHYINAPLRSTILVINYKYKKVDNRKKVFKLLKESKNSLYYVTKKLYDNELPSWITTFLKSKKRTIQPPAAMMLVEFLGNDLNKIANELDKLLISLPADVKDINPKHIEENIGISKDYNNFELTNALAAKEVVKANRIITYFAQNPKDNPLTMTLALLYMFFSKVVAIHFSQNKNNSGALAGELKIHPGLIKNYMLAARNYTPKKAVQIIHWLREYDLRSKGKNNVSTSDGELLKELIFKILH